MKHTVSAILVTVAIISLASCDPQPELCFDHSHDRIPIEVIFDWSDCPNANPETMSLYLFSKDRDEYRRHEFSDHTGGKILVIPGIYTVIAVNSDNNTVKVNNSGRAEDFEITLRNAYEQQGLSSKTETPLCFAPDSLWISYIDHLIIDDNKLVIHMTEAFCLYSVEISHINNRHLVSSIGATLSGMHNKLLFGGRDDDATATSIMFSLDGYDEAKFYCEFFTFGHCGHSRTRSSDNEHKIDFIFTLGDGSARCSSVDVTEQIHSQPTDRCHIVIDTLNLPIQQTGNIGTSVEEWISNEFIITLNK